MQSFRNTAGCVALALAGLGLFVPQQSAAQINSKTFLVPATDAVLADQANASAAAALACKGKPALVDDLAYEGVKTTAWNFANATGGGLGNRFDPVPVLSTAVTLAAGCLNAHFSAIVGSSLYGGVSNMTLFQISLTPPTGGPLIPMIGHYPTPYGVAAPAVAMSAEYDVDTIGTNFYLPVGTKTGQVPPGTYKLNVWWAGGPTAAGGAIGAAFVLKLYQQ